MARTKSYDVHPYAEIFPLLGREEMHALRDSIQEHGQLEPIVLYKGEILDGRNRYMACYGAKVNVKVRHGKFATDEEALDFVINANILRRHLTASQRAMVAPTVRKLHDDMAKARQAHGETAPGKSKPNASGKLTSSVRGPQARDAIGKVLGVSGTYADRAGVIYRQSPELAAAVMAGEMSLNAAYKKVKPTEETESPLSARFAAWATARASYLKATEKFLASDEKLNKADRKGYEGGVKRFGKAGRAVVKIFRRGK